MNQSSTGGFWGAFWRAAGATGTMVGGGLEVGGGIFNVIFGFPVSGVLFIFHGIGNIAMGAADLTFTIVNYEQDAQSLILGEYGSAIWDATNAYKSFTEGNELLDSGKYFRAGAAYADGIYSVYEAANTVAVD